MKHIGLFEGIGGFSLAARWMGWKTVAWCEWNEFGQKVLRHHFPEAEGHGDITKTDFTKYANRIDILTGGFPCQPYSTAGKRLGKEDERHLWPEMLRAIREIAPRYVVGENVRGLVSWNGGMVFDEVQTDLETCGYEVLPFILSACAVNAPHRRDRIWFVAKNTISNGRVQREPKQERTEDGQLRNTRSGNSVGVCLSTGDASDATIQRSKERIKTGRWADETKIESGMVAEFERLSNKQFAANSCFAGLQGRKINGSTGGIRQKSNEFTAGRIPSTWQNFPTQSPICIGDDGLSSRLDNITFPKWRNESIKAGGNAIVPQVAYQIFKAIEESENQITND